MLEELKKAVCQANKDLVKHGLVLLSWGNVSAIDRKKGIVAIKPSGVPFGTMKIGDIVLLDLDGNVVEGDKKPSTDTATHLEIYRNFPEANAVIHTHSLYATSFAQAKRGVKCLGTTHADHFYGTVPVTRDMMKEEIEKNFELNTGKVIIETFREQKINPTQMPACLVASHGPFVWGKNLKDAMGNAIVLEYSAQININTLIASGKSCDDIKSVSDYLLDKHFLRKHGKNAYYGQK